MNFETLELFCEVVRRQSFSAGARTLKISQPAASQAISHLEQELAVKLIDRSKRPFRLTAAGQLYFDGVRGILQNYENLTTEIRSTRAEVAGTVHVVAIYSIGLHVMRHQIQQFISKYPEAKIRLEYLHPSKVLESVISEDADLGLISYPSQNRTLEITHLRNERMVFVCPPGHELARKEIIHAHHLDGVNFVAFDHDLAIRKAIDKSLSKGRAHPNIVLQFDNIETIKQAVEIGAGISILPEPTVLKEVGQRSLLAIPLAMTELTRPIGIIRRKSKNLTPAASKFLNLLKAPEVLQDQRL